MSENVPATIQLDEFGNVKPTTIDEAFRVAKSHSIGGMLPERYHGKPEMVFTAMAMARELRLPPVISLKSIAVIKGTPCLFGDLPLGVVMGSGKLQSIHEFVFDKEMKEISFANKNLAAEVYGAICRVKRVGDPNQHETFFTMDEAKAAALLGNPTWKNYPKHMLKYRARSQALKDKFPDALNGISIGEYDHNAMEDSTINMSKDEAGTYEPAPKNNDDNSFAEALKKKAQSAKAQTVDAEIVE